MTKRRNKLNQDGFAWLFLFVFVSLLVLISIFLRGTNVSLFNPQGLIAQQQHSLMKEVTWLLLLIGIPSVLLLYFIAWKYRESNTSAKYEPETKHGKLFNISAWAVPTTVMLILASVMWPATHKLEPRKLIDPDIKPLTIQVISMRWKWLFIYPSQKIATINFVQVPLNTPVQFELTADEAPMSSFWIPNLGGQLYSMTGHVNRLNLVADNPGDYPGSSAELNGAGFAGMKFIARASNQQDFDLWVQDVKQSGGLLDESEYAKVLKPSQDNPIALYSDYVAGLYDNVITKYLGPSGAHSHL